MKKNLSQTLKNLKSKIYFDYNIGKHTWFKTGGNAKIFVIAENSSELEIIFNEIENENFYILGAGSNLLIRDKGFNGIIIKLGKEFNNINITDDKLEVGASTLDINLSKFAYQNSIEGLEFYSGIPGSLGGAVKMNAGCFGSETKDSIHSIEIFNKKFEKKTLLKKDINLSYRSSNIKSDQIILKAYFNISYGDQENIRDKILKIKKRRLLTQPIKNKTSGSTFKNPYNFHAAKLIEASGCKGLKYGDAIVSEKHSNFLINNGRATATDIENLGKLIIERVYKKFDLKLEWEVKIIGEY